MIPTNNKDVEMASNHTAQVFNELLKKYQPWQAMEDYVKRSDFFLKNVQVKKDFIEDIMAIPFITAGHTNVRAGKLTPTNEVTRGDGAVGELKDEELMELWGTIKVTSKDIRKHKSAEKSFKAMFPQKISGLMETMKEQVSVQFLQDGSICSIVSGGTPASGVVKVNRPERLSVRQRLDFKGDTTTIAGFIRQIDMEQDLITVYDAEEGGSVVDLSGIGANAGVYVYDHANNDYDTLKSMLLPASQGGSANLHGIPKLSSPILQAHYEDCSGFSASTILDDVYKVFRKVKQKGKVKKASIVVPYFVFNDLVLKAQNNKRYSASDVEAGYGFDKVTVHGAGGAMEIFGVFDLTDTGYIMDWDHLYLCTQEMFTTNRDLGDEPWHAERTEDGMVYLLDICFRGGLAIRKASGFGILDKLNYGA